MTFTLKLNSKYEKKSAMLDLKTTCRLPRWGHFCGHPPNETLACGLTEVIRKQNLRMLLYSHQPCFTASPHETKVALNICFSWRKMELLVSVSAMCLMLFFFFFGGIILWNHYNTIQRMVFSAFSRQGNWGQRLEFQFMPIWLQNCSSPQCGAGPQAFSTKGQT